MQPTLLVGDVHGCRAELEELLHEAGWTPRMALVLVGDLVAKGPDSQGVVALARHYGARAVLGNHDAHVLRARAYRNGELAAGEKPPSPEHAAVVDALSLDDFAYLEHLPLYLNLGPETEGAPDTLAVHAGLVPGIPLAAQRPSDLMNLRSIREDGTPTKKLDGRPWGSVWQGPERVVYGHDAVRGLQLYPFATGLDTGCVYGRKLTGLILPERRLVSVDAHRAYTPMEKPKA